MPADTQYVLTERLDRQILPAQAGTFGIVNNDVSGKQIVITISTLGGGPAGDVIYLRKLGESLTIDRSTLRAVTIEALDSAGSAPSYPATILFVDTDLPVSVTSIGSAIAGAAGYDPLIVQGSFDPSGGHGAFGVIPQPLSEGGVVSPAVGDGDTIHSWVDPLNGNPSGVPLASSLVTLTVAGLDVAATVTPKVQIEVVPGSGTWQDYVTLPNVTTDGVTVYLFGKAGAVSAGVTGAYKAADVLLPPADNLRLVLTVAGMGGPTLSLGSFFYSRVIS